MKRIVLFITLILLLFNFSYAGDAEKGDLAFRDLTFEELAVWVLNFIGLDVDEAWHTGIYYKYDDVQQKHSIIESNQETKCSGS